jgi:arsenate reductase
MTLNVLFLCTGNSARSILAEAILNRVGAGRFRAWSAGSHPKGEVNPHALELLQWLRYDVSQFRSKPWDEFAASDAPKLDFVITVCDDAAGEVCPVWPGRPVTAHWGMPDPAAVQGSSETIARAFAETYHLLEKRLSLFAQLELAGLDGPSLQNCLADVARRE